MVVLATTIRLGNVNLRGKGFRGGPLVDRIYNGGAYLQGYRDDSSIRVNVSFNGPKGEGFIGMPRFLSAPSTYPNGLDCARGAPGNAGGGGNFVDCGAGGGANAGRGGDGLFRENRQLPGIGGAPVPTDATRLLFLGM